MAFTELTAAQLTAATISSSAERRAPFRADPPSPSVDQPIPNGTRGECHRTAQPPAIHRVSTPAHPPPCVRRRGLANHHLGLNREPWWERPADPHAGRRRARPTPHPPHRRFGSVRTTAPPTLRVICSPIDMGATAGGTRGAGGSARASTAHDRVWAQTAMAATAQPQPPWPRHCRPIGQQLACWAAAAHSARSRCDHHRHGVWSDTHPTPPTPHRPRHARYTAHSPSAASPMMVDRDELGGRRRRRRGTEAAV